MSGINVNFEDLVSLLGVPINKIIKLKNLDLSSYRIKNLNPDLISHLTSLTCLDLSDNLLTSLPSSSPHPKVTSLDISQNKFTDLTFLKNFPNLTHLRSQDNNLEISQKFLATYLCPQLVKLDEGVVSMRASVDAFVHQVWNECASLQGGCTGAECGDGSGGESEVMNQCLKSIRSKRFLGVGLPTLIKDFIIKRECGQLLSKRKLRLTKSTTTTTPSTTTNNNTTTNHLKSPTKSTNSTKSLAKNSTLQQLVSPTKPQTTTPIKRHSTKTLTTTPSKTTKLSTTKSSTTTRSSYKVCSVKNNKSKQQHSPCQVTPLRLQRISPRKSGGMVVDGENGGGGKVVDGENGGGDDEEDKEEDKSNDDDKVKKEITKRRLSFSPLKLNNNNNINNNNHNNNNKKSCNTEKSPNKRFKHSTNTQDANQGIPEYEPISFLRCHSGDRGALKEGFSLDDPSDDVTNVWGCAFEPHPSEPGRTTGVVATCGGSVLCLIDVCSGKVMKRWERGKEQFYCLAWSTICINNKNTNVLAVSGHNGMLKLLCPSQLLCYHEHGNGRPNRQVIDFYYSSLVFHPSLPTHLFCSSSDSTITLLDIGVPQGSDMSTVVKRLSVFNSQPAASVSVTLFVQTYDWLLGATVAGLMVWEVGKNHSMNKRKTPIKVVKLDSKVKSVDALVLLSHQRLAVKYIGHAHIVIYKLDHLTVLHNLRWIQTDVDYIGMGANQDLLLCGSNNGHVLLYDTHPSIQPSQPQTTVWPLCLIDEKHPEDYKMKDLLNDGQDRVINNVCVDENGGYFVAVTDCNLVCIWKKITNKPRLSKFIL